jgi:phosphatidylinositol kinase/protein kinase (PI-3  family)
VSGVEGNYRISCKNTLSVLMENKESIMAVLEAFVYDPLINWDQTKRRCIAEDLSEGSLRFIVCFVLCCLFYGSVESLLPLLFSHAVLKDVNPVKPSALDSLLYGSGANVASPLAIHPSQSGALPNPTAFFPNQRPAPLQAQPPVSSLTTTDSGAYLDANKLQPAQNKKALTVLDRIAHKLNGSMRFSSLLFLSPILFIRVADL